MFDAFRRGIHKEALEEQRQDAEELDRVKLSAEKKPDKRVAVSGMYAIDRAESDRKMMEIKERLADDRDASALQRELDLIKEDAELDRLVREIFENGNSEVLREKSAKQVDEMTKLFFEGATILKPREYLMRKKKLRQFQEFVQSLTPVRADRNDYDEFLAPDQTGEIGSYGVMDTLIHAEEFVYGSFGEIPHFMANNPSQKELEKEGIEERTQIVMNDVNNVRGRVDRGESFMKKYVTNLFDFENGEKILALYFASVFESPDQVSEVLGNVGPDEAQNWDDRPMLYYRNRDFVADSTEDYRAQEKREEELTEIFNQRMKDILAKTGIEPPLSLELRIRRSARVKQ